VPVADATLWDLAEQVADSAWPVFESLWNLAAQGEVIFQDDTHVRILALLAENRRADIAGDTLERRGMYTTGLVVQVEKRVICLYRSGRAPAGDNLTALLARREPGLETPIVMSDALAANQRDDDDTLIRCHCLAHGRRQFTTWRRSSRGSAPGHHRAESGLRARGGNARPGDDANRAVGLSPSPERPVAGSAS